MDFFTTTKNNLRESTKRTYRISIRRLYRGLNQDRFLKVHEDGDKQSVDSLDFLSDADLVVDYLEQFMPNTRKSYLNAIIVLLKSQTGDPIPALKTYEKLRDGYNTAYQDEMATGNKTEKQKSQWVEWDSYLKMIKQMYADVKSRKLRRKKELDSVDLRLFGDLVLCELYAAFPLRNDFAGVKVMTQREYKKLGDTEQNILVKTPMRFILNSYKTDKTYGKKEYPIQGKLKNLIVDWLKVNTTGELLINMTANGITKALNRITKTRLGKSVGSSMLRHSYLSSKYADSESEKKKDADKMGHSTSTQKLYIKK